MRWRLWSRFRCCGWERAERISAIVKMKNPGVWVMGDLADDDRGHGMGIGVEYAGHRGKPQWVAPKPFHWNYLRFGKAEKAAEADETIEIIFKKRNALEDGFNQWTVNGVAFAMEKPEAAVRLRQGRRYRLRMRNASEDIHPIHLHRHSFELTKFAGKATSGVMKDMIMVGGYQEVEVDFVADNPGLTLFHCHQQLHMDFGFMSLFEYVKPRPSALSKPMKLNGKGDWAERTAKAVLLIRVL
jgi:FtsP/CotA-like multicopper oxidase with cupredoxin domain